MLIAGGHVESCSGGSRLCQLSEEGRQARMDGEQGKQAHSCAVLSAQKAAAEQRLASTGEPRTARAAALLQTRRKNRQTGWFCGQMQCRGSAGAASEDAWGSVHSSYLG